jgi:hypothetical protein
VAPVPGVELPHFVASDVALYPGGLSSFQVAAAVAATLLNRSTPMRKVTSSSRVGPATMDFLALSLRSIRAVGDIS